MKFVGKKCDGFFQDEDGCETLTEFARSPRGRSHSEIIRCEAKDLFGSNNNRNLQFAIRFRCMLAGPFHRA